MLAEVSLGAPDNAIGFVLWRLVHRFQREIDRQLAPGNLTHLQFTTLALVAWLSRNQGFTSQADISRHGDIQPMQVSLMLRALEGRRMITRTRSGSHPTAKRVQITAVGINSLRKAMPIAVEIQRKMFGEAAQPGGPLLRTLLEIADFSSSEED